MQWIYAGTRWRWYDVVRANDVFDVDAKLTDVETKTGRRFGLWVLQKGEIEFRRSDGALVCLAEGRVARTPRRRRSADTTGSEATETPARREDAGQSAGGSPTTASGEPSGSEPVKPSRRGGEPRHWESVEPGDTLETCAIVLTLERIFAWYTGAQGALHYGGAHADGVRYRHRHDDYEINAQTGAKDSAARGHFSSKEGRDVGMGGTYDVGLQRIAWVVAYVTDWMGDDAHLAEADIDVVAPNLVGDTTYFSGVVTDRWYDENAFVDIAIEGRNQKGAVTTKGHVAVALPSTEYGAVRLPLFGGDGRRWTSPPMRGE